MSRYTVRWEIDLEADSAEHAVILARDHMPQTPNPVPDPGTRFFVLDRDAERWQSVDLARVKLEVD